jgi:hypothetical protein
MTGVQSLQGSCLCGEVQFNLTGTLRPVAYCHCSQCRKTHGHFGAYTSVQDTSLQIENNQGLAWYRASNFARRGFCRECGSSLFWQGDATSTISIAAGSLELPTGLTADRHIFVNDAGDYYQITDGLEVFPQAS